MTAAGILIKPRPIYRLEKQTPDLIWVHCLSADIQTQSIILFIYIRDEISSSSAKIGASRWWLDDIPAGPYPTK
jgi:hypothetical protein